MEQHDENRRTSTTLNEVDLNNSSFKNATLAEDLQLSSS
jgi:hypothetical protein